MRVPVAAFALLAMILLAGCGAASDRNSPTKQARASRATGPLLKPGDSSFPSVGLVYPLARGSVLTRVDGRVLGHLPPGANLDPGTEQTFVSIPGTTYVVRDRRLVRVTKSRIDLAGNAVIVNGPGHVWTVRRNGAVVWRPPAETSASLSRDRDVVTAWRTSGQAIAFDVVTGRTRSLPKGCAVTDRKAAAWILVCDRPSPTPRRSTIELLTADGRARLLSEDRMWGSGAIKTLNTGVWRWAELAPDGSTLLAQWSGECETPRAMVIPAGGGRPVPVTREEKLARAPESTALGWLPNGRAIVSLSQGGCGPGARRPGVYAIAPGRAPELLFGTRWGMTPEIWRSVG